MKTKRLIIIFLIFLLAAPFTSCIKHPLISFRSKMKRVEGSWEVWGFYINGQNATDSLSFIYNIIFVKRDESNGPNFNTFHVYFNNNTLPDWAKQFSFKKNELILNNPYKNMPVGVPNFFPYEFRLLMQENSIGSLSFKILKLRFNSMILERKINGNDYRLELKKTSK